MDKLTQIRTFIRIAERASFSAVARDMQITQSSVSKSIRALESSLGVRLVNRSTRSVTLTEAGRRYYERCRIILSDLDEAEAAVGDLNAGVKGTLNIAAPVPFGLMFISPRVVRFKGLYPALAINLDLNDLPVNLVENNIDVAIRLGHPDAPGLAVRKLGSSPFITVASPAYLTAHGMPDSPKRLTAHRCLVYSNEERPLEWGYTGATGYRGVTVTGEYMSNNLLALKDAALAGIGIARLPLWMVDAEIKSGLLRPVLERFQIPPFGIHAVFPSVRQIPVKVKYFVDFIRHELMSIQYFSGLQHNSPRPKRAK